MKFGQAILLLVTLLGGLGAGYLLSKSKTTVNATPKQLHLGESNALEMFEQQIQLIDDLRKQNSSVRQQLRTQQRLSAGEIEALTAALLKAQSGLLERQIEPRQDTKVSVAAGVAEDPDFFAEKADDVERYMPYMPFRSYRAYRSYKAYAKSVDRSVAGSKADCFANPFAGECRGTFVSCKYDSDTEECIGTDQYCRQFSQSKYCVGTELYCNSNPRGVHCAGTYSWCREMPDDKICAGTKPFCEKNVLHAACLGTKLHCTKAFGKPCS